MVNGEELYYEVHGTGDPLVLIHAEALDGRIWDEQIPAFSKYYKTITYDRRNHGKSNPTEDQNFSASASDINDLMEQLEKEPPLPAPHEDLRSLLDFLEIEKTCLLGMEVGGGIAIDFTLEYPEAVDALVLVASSLGGRLPSEESLERMAWVPEAWEEALSTGNPASFVDRSLEDPIYSSSTEETKRRLRQIFVDNALSFLAPRGLNAPMLDPPAAQRLHEINVPTLVVVGEEDEADAHELSDELTKGIKHSEKVILPRASRQINMDRAERFNDTVLNFLDRQYLSG